MLYKVLRPVAWLLCKILFRLKIKGRENIPVKGGFIIAANHSSYIDPVVLAVAVPRKVSWIVKKDVYDVWWLKGLFAMTGMIRENGSVDKAVAVVRKAGAVGVFPEGTRSYDGKLGPGKKGVAVMALRTGAPVVPCRIKGAFEAFPRTAAFPRPFQVTVNIGKPVRAEKDDSPDDGKLDSFLDTIMSEVGKIPPQI